MGQCPFSSYTMNSRSSCWALRQQHLCSISRQPACTCHRITGKLLFWRGLQEVINSSLVFKAFQHASCKTIQKIGVTLQNKLPAVKLIYLNAITVFYYILNMTEREKFTFCSLAYILTLYISVFPNPVIFKDKICKTKTHNVKCIFSFFNLINHLKSIWRQIALL